MRGLALLLLAPLAACQLEGSDAVDAYEETSPSLYCGTVEPSENAKLVTEAEAARQPRRADVKGGILAVHVHVIRKGEGLANGDVSDTAIAQQLRVLDAAYADAGWSFELASIDRTTQPAWFPLRAGSAEETAAKTALHRGTARDLNLYIAEPGNGMIGYATFPTHYESAPHHDGVVILHSTLPGGSSAPYNLGDQTVHQVGHWLGLYHTYQADCSTDRGDFVADTAPSSMPAFGCPVGRDTCGASGDDPVRNYMDSTDDGCMNAFTDGQRARIHTQFDAFRRFP
jgi:hypothetical protein